MLSHHKKYFYLLASVIFMQVGAISLQAQVSIEANQPSRPISPKEVVWFFDNTGERSFNEIKDTTFTAFDKNNISATQKNNNTWVRIELNNNTGTD